ncbi:MAG: 16S rRNA (guanine(966)-N(2))-methyltransferase RsmD [Mariprofundaceae bacterium]
MRITAGELRGRKVTMPEIPGLRPTPSKVRQALFNILQDVQDWNVLDLFSGSGLMALECLSRKAGRVISIEKNSRLCQHMIDTREAWELRGRWQIYHGKVNKVTGNITEASFDLVYADPPYDQGFAERIPHWLSKVEVRIEHLVIEESSRARPHWPEGWTQTACRRYGDTCLYFLEQERRK